jgi:hypothetical protein
MGLSVTELISDQTKVCLQIIWPIHVHSHGHTTVGDVTVPEN